MTRISLFSGFFCYFLGSQKVTELDFITKHYPMPKDPGFDAFFEAMTSSPEFKSTVTKDWKKDSKELLDTSLEEMQKGVEHAGQLFENFQKTFGEAKDFSSPSQQNTEQKMTGEEKKESPLVEIKRPVKKDPKTYGFLGVAGMSKLKKELEENFIKPLRFKFLIESIKAKQESSKEEKKELTLNAKEKLYLELYESYEKFKISIPTGMLFYGPPGTGKTFITKKLAEELECGFVSKNMGEFGSSYVHQTTKNIKDFFEAVKKASEQEPILLFLDEIDSLVSARTSNIDSNKAEEVSQFLQEFNSLEDFPNLIVIAATNRPDHLDPAILRSGRLDKKIYIGPPDDIAREELFKMYLEKKGRPTEKLDYEELSRLTIHYISADIEAICDEVARDASQNLLDIIPTLNDEADLKDIDSHSITMDSLRKTILETPSSLKAVDMSIYENWLKKMEG